MNTTSSLSLDQAAELLQASPDYHVLRRLQPREVFTAVPLDQPLLRGLVLDCETTGKNHRRHRIHQLGLILFEYTPDGQVVRVLDRYLGEEDPEAPLPQRAPEPGGFIYPYFDEARVLQMLDGVSIVIAHHAGFDRPFVEKRFPAFSKVAWGCSWKDVDWYRAGMECGKLAYLAAEFGFFYTAHDADQDCEALLEILSRALPGHGQTVLKTVLERAASPMVRIWATGAKGCGGLLADHDYHWGRHSKCHYKEVPIAAQEAELAWLRRTVYLGRNRSSFIILETLPANVRYADRRYPGQQRPLVTDAPAFVSEVRHVAR